MDTGKYPYTRTVNFSLSPFLTLLLESIGTHPRRLASPQLKKIFNDFEGAAEMDIDDIVILRTTEEEHDHCLEFVLQRGKKVNLTLNKETCDFKSKEITYAGPKLIRKKVLNLMKRKS